LVAQIFLGLPLQSLQHAEHIQGQLRELDLEKNGNLVGGLMDAMRVQPVRGSCQQ
jgi:hypothetical protein